jgi:lipopolysaccharide transport system ATP-binding protein
MDRTYKTFCESITDTIKSPLKRLKSFSRQEEVFWALKDINFEVCPGEVVGIIGRNGAGKTTLLKILSRITHPTEGEVILRGRVASLLEVGTGFHPELTGRENIYFNGAILGMTKQEIVDKFDEIVAFSGVEDFLDTPLKRYSSGMQVRLAFAVAAHLDPEILVVDEVLAVGDVEFQKKCLGKMKDVAAGGRTVLFVSHNMGAISTLTKQALLLEEGRLKMVGPTEQVVRNYLMSLYPKATEWRAPVLNQKAIQILYAKIESKNDSFDVRKELTITIDYEIRRPVREAVVTVAIQAFDGTEILNTEDIDLHPKLLETRLPGKYRARVSIPCDLFRAGTYLLKLHSGIIYKEIYDLIEVLSFDLIDTGNPKIREHKGAYICPYLNWDFERIPDQL